MAIKIVAAVKMCRSLCMSGRILTARDANIFQTKGVHSHREVDRTRTGNGVVATWGRWNTRYSLRGQGEKREQVGVGFQRALEFLVWLVLFYTQWGAMENFFFKPGKTELEFQLCSDEHPLNPYFAE